MKKNTWLEVESPLLFFSQNGSDKYSNRGACPAATRKLLLWAMNWAKGVDLPRWPRDQVFIVCSHARMFQALWAPSHQQQLMISGSKAPGSNKLIREEFETNVQLPAGMYLVSDFKSRVSQAPGFRTQGHKSEAWSTFLRLHPDIGWLPVECLHAAWMAPPASPRPRASRELLSSGVGHALLLLCDSCKCPFTECRIVAKFVRSVHSRSTWDISPASHFPLEVKARCEHHLGPSQHHQWTKMGLLIHSKSHNQNAQKDLDKQRAWLLSVVQGCVLHCLEICPRSSLPSLPEWNASEVVYESDPGAGRRQWALWLLGVTVDLDLLFGYL